MSRRARMEFVGFSTEGLEYSISQMSADKSARLDRTRVWLSSRFKAPVIAPNTVKSVRELQSREFANDETLTVLAYPSMASYYC